MQDIQNKAIENYNQNMMYFQENHPLLHNKLFALDTILNDGSYKQKYDLEYKDAYFDVIELDTDTLLYNQDSQKFSDNLTKELNFKKDTQSFKTTFAYKFSDKALTKLNDADALTVHSTTAPIINYYDSNIDPSMHLVKIPKFIFIGVGLALHIPKTMEKINPSIVLIIENNIELFRLSLFTCNYEQTFQDKTVLFSIGQNHGEFKETFSSFFTSGFSRNLYLKFSLFSSQYAKIIKDIQMLLVTRPEIGYTHERLLYKNKLVLEKFSNNYKFLNFSKKNEKTFLFDKPVLVLGAGPSLHANLEWLKQNSDKFIIISVFAALKTIHKIGIKPDIIVQIDENDATTQKQLDYFKEFDFIKDSIYILSASVPDCLFKLFTKKQIYLMEDRTAYKKNNSVLLVASVGETAYAVPLIFNASDIYLLGLDFAFSEDGSTHAKDHEFSKKVDISNIEKIDTAVSLGTSVKTIKGNFKQTVTTNALLSMSLAITNSFTSILKSSNQHIYNLSDGAYLDNVTPLKIDDFKYTKKIDKKKLSIELQTFFDSYSCSEIQENELEALYEKEKQIKNYYIYLKKIEQNNSSNKDIFMESYYDFLQVVMDSNKSELKEILVIYFFKTSPYITDFFNTKGIENPKRHIKKLKKIILTQLYKIIKHHETELLEIMEDIKKS